MSATYNRRQWLSAAAVSGVAACTASTTKPGARMPTFVLVPGTWHGGWVWTPLAKQLRAAGAQAYPVTCTGLGDRHHLLTPNVGLETHIEDVVNLIEWEELDQVVLIGHSFAGLTITGVADRIPDRIQQLIFYDAFIPTPERPAWVVRDSSGQWPAWWIERQKKFIEGYKMDFFAEYPIEMLVDPSTYPEIAARLWRRLTPHPAKQWTEPVSFANGGWQNTARSYVHCVGQSFRPSSVAMYGPAEQPGWTFVEIDTPRLGMLTDTAKTAQLLLELAAT